MENQLDLFDNTTRDLIGRYCTKKEAKAAEKIKTKANKYRNLYLNERNLRIEERERLVSIIEKYDKYVKDQEQKIKQYKDNCTCKIWSLEPITFNARVVQKN